MNDIILIKGPVSLSGSAKSGRIKKEVGTLFILFLIPTQ